MGNLYPTRQQLTEGSVEVLMTLASSFKSPKANWSETSNFTEVFDKDHISWISYSADVTSASSYMA